MKERLAMVRAMETVIRNLNDESFLDSWLMCGVADGDIDGYETDESLEYYCEDKNFSELMGLFARIMKRATKGENQSGTFYCDGMIS